MLSGLFQSTTIPVLEQVINFSQARHGVLAGNIANADTPGYKARDLSVEDFEKRLQKAIRQRTQPTLRRSPGEPASGYKPLLAEVADNSKTILRHDKAKVGMEYQVTEMAKNQMQHNLAISVMGSQFRLLQAAISGRA
jgi:flagellar basal-body rod protein FlgB